MTAVRIDTQSSLLPNGLRVVTVPDHATACGAAAVWLPVGGRHEAARLCGISHFLEHLVFKGTRRLSARDIARSIERRGGYLDAYTQEEMTCFHVRIPAAHLDEAVAVLAELVAHPRLAADDVDRERDVIAEEIAMYRDQPAHLAEDLLMESLWADHPLGRPLTGTERSLARIRASDVRAHHARSYVPNGAILGVAGPVLHRRMERLAESLFGAARPGRRPRVRAADARVRRVPLATREKAVDQAQVAIGFRALGREAPRRFALRLGSVIMGENMSSRLFRRVREERGLAYSVSTAVTAFEETGYLSVEAGLDRARLLPGVDLILAELGELTRRPPTRRELAEARDYAVGQLRLGLETVSSRLHWVGEQLLHRAEAHSPAEIESRLLAVTAAEVRAAWRDVVCEAGSAFVLVGPDAGDAERSALSRLIRRRLRVR